MTSFAHDFKNDDTRWGSGTGAGVGGRLTSLQEDVNWYNAQQWADDVQAAIDAGLYLASPPVTFSGNALTFHFSDGSTAGPYLLPVAMLNPRGEWQPSTSYNYLDLVNVTGTGLFLVLEDHTSDTSFDPNATDGTTANNPLYQQWGPSPTQLPVGGTAGQVLRKASATAFDVEWHSELLSDLGDISFPTAGPSSGDILQFDGTDWVNKTLAELGLLSDVAFTTAGAASGDLLQYNGTDWVNEQPIDVVRLTTVTALGTTGTVSLDPTLGDVFTITPTAGVTLNAASAPAGARITLIVITSGTSSFNITPTTNFKSTGALATGTVSGKYFTLTFVGDGTNLIETSRTVAM